MSNNFESGPNWRREKVSAKDLFPILFFLLVVPVCVIFICIAVQFGELIDNVPDWLVVSFLVLVCVVFGISRIKKMIK